MLMNLLIEDNYYMRFVIGKSKYIKETMNGASHQEMNQKPFRMRNHHQNTL